MKAVPIKMHNGLLLLGFGFWAAITVTARHTPRSPSQPLVYLHDLVQRGVSYPTLEQDPSGFIPYFVYEENYLPAHESLPHLFQHASNLTTGPTNNTFKGPGNCRVFPGDTNWPAFDDWAALDNITRGALLNPAPQAHICYGNVTGNASQSGACLALTEKWTDPFTHLNDPIEMLTPMYQGMTCQPPRLFNKTGICEQGGYPLYVVNASSVAQIQLAVNFARNTGIRLVIKNTGHDFAGKSGGAGSLSVWTHNLKDIAFMPSYDDGEYSGPAIKAGVGVQGFELYAAANQFGMIALGGECPTVGTMGGWIQGGGHSPASSVWGIGADHALGFEVVTADGRFVTANKDKNSDLFWALRGGGGGTFGIVTSVAVKVFKDMPVTAASWIFSTGPNVTDEAFSAGLKAYFETFPSGAANEIYAYFNVFNMAGVKTFTMAPYFALGKTFDQTQALLASWFTRMHDLGIPLRPDWKTYDGFYAAYNASLPVEAVNNLGIATASRMFPRQNIENKTLFDTTYKTLWNNLDSGLALIGYNIAPKYYGGGSPDNAVNPAWRDTIGFLITGTFIDLSLPASEQLLQRQNLTLGVMQQWRDLTPGSGAYLSEGDRMEPNFQWSFYGSHYPRLLKVKQRYDPTNLFYAHTAVGSEFFVVRTESGAPDENGRLCANESPSLYEAEGRDYDL